MFKIAISRFGVYNIFTLKLLSKYIEIELTKTNLDDYEFIEIISFGSVYSTQELMHPFILDSIIWVVR